MEDFTNVLVNEFKKIGKGVSILAVGNLGVKKGSFNVQASVPEGEGVIVEFLDANTYINFLKEKGKKVSLIEKLALKSFFKKGYTIVVAVSQSFYFVCFNDTLAVFRGGISDLKAWTVNDGERTEYSITMLAYDYWLSHSKIWKEADSKLSFKAFK